MSLSVGSIISLCGTTLGVGVSNRGAKLYISSTQYSSATAEHMFIHDTGWGDQSFICGVLQVHHLKWTRTKQAAEKKMTLSYAVRTRGSRGRGIHS